MAKKRVTMKDVAEAAGVSKATVSYVLNYSEKEKISHETRMRIFEVANNLKYVPNMNARSLSSQKNFLVGIIVNVETANKRSKLYQYYDLSVEIQRELNRLGYDVLFLQTKEVERDITISQRRSLDAVFIMDMKETLLKTIANKFFVPAIFIDGYVDDPVFCKVVSDSDAILKRAKEQLGDDFYVVMEDYSNKSLYDNVQRMVKSEDIFINRSDCDLIGFLQKHMNQKGLVVGEILGIQVENYVDNRNLSVVVHSEKESMLLPDTKRIIVSNRQKAIKAVDVMDKLLKLDEPDKVERVTLIGPE